jgi:DMSO/TMAO reductase YedYZ heme-binding membrane subunit
MTIILFTAFLTTIISLFLYRPIHKYKYIIYGITGIIALVLLEEANVVSLGYVPFGIFVVVMLSGALDKGVLRKRLFMVRSELSVIGTILLVPHSLGYLEYYLDDIGLLNADISFLFGVLSVVVVIPLFVTSFRFVRKRFTYKNWSTLHKFAYLFYALVGLHLILIQNDRMWLYIVLFSVYFLLKASMILPGYIKKMQSGSISTKKDGA